MKRNQKNSQPRVQMPDMGAANNGFLQQNNYHQPQAMQNPSQNQNINYPQNSGLQPNGNPQPNAAEQQNINYQNNQMPQGYNNFQQSMPNGQFVSEAPNETRQTSDAGKLSEDELELLRSMPPIPHVIIDAFCIDRHTADTIRNISNDRRIQKSTINIEEGGIPGAIRKYTSSPTPNLMIVECNDVPELMLSLLDQLSENCEERTKVLVIGNYNDVGLYRELVSRGISDYIVSPVSTVQMLDFIANLYGRKSTKKIGSLISFISAKGGIGSSTIVHNVAWIVAEMLKEKISLVDLDLGFGSASLDFNKDVIQSVFEALQAPERFDSVLLDRLLTQCTENLSLFASPVSLEHDYNFTEENFIPVLDVLRENVPYSLIDLPHGWNGWIKKCLLLSDDIYITSAPDLVSLRNARNLRERMIALRENDRPPKIILCPVGVPKKPEVHIDDIQKAIAAQADYMIPFEPEIFGRASNDGLMIHQMDPKSEINNVFIDIAMSIAGRKNRQQSVNNKSSNLMSFVESIISRKKAS